MIKIAPSILAANPLHMGRDIGRMRDAGCDLLHVDIMDGHFVPNLSYGPALVKAIAGEFSLPQDVHLMIEEPDRYIRTFADNGAAGITVHAEIPGGAENALREIRALGLTAGVSIKPGTPADAILPLLPLCDLILVMTVEPGFGGQAFMPEMTDKLRWLRAQGYCGLLEADGGIGMAQLPLLADAGLDIAVMGTAMFRSADPAADIRAAHAL